MITNNRNELAKMLRQRRLMAELTLVELAAGSGVSASHIGRIERGERLPSGHILRKIAKPLGLAETELLTLAGYLSPQPSSVIESPGNRQLDAYVAKVLAEEPVATQRTVIGMLTIFKSMAKGGQCDIEFAEYAHRKYPEVDEDTITMIEDILEHPRISSLKGGYAERGKTKRGSELSLPGAPGIKI